MEYSVKEIAQLLDGDIQGDADVRINNLSRIEDGQPHTISFLANPKYSPHVYKTKASAVIVGRDFKPEQKISSTLIKVDDAYLAFAALLKAYNGKNDNKLGINKSAYVASSASYGKNVYLGAFSYIGEHVVLGNNVKIFPGAYIGDYAKIGDNTIVYSGVKIYQKCKIGKNCTLHSNAVIGADGFGFAPSNQHYVKIHQIGSVIIEDNVEIGSSSTIDAATVGSTIIKHGVKIDNLVQIAHNVEIGENTLIAAQTGVAGSTKIGKNCMIGGQVGIIGHLTIADGVQIAAQSGLSKDVNTPGANMFGSPAFAADEYKKAYIGFRKLPQLLKKIAILEAEIDNLKNGK